MLHFVHQLADNFVRLLLSGSWHSFFLSICDENCDKVVIMSQNGKVISLKIQSGCRKHAKRLCRAERLDLSANYSSPLQQQM